MEGESIAEVFAKHGVALLRADNARIPGWQRVREYLADAEDGKPLLQIFSTCVNLIRTLPQLLHDTKNLEDAAGGEDHAPEALRYGLMSRPAKSKPVLPQVAAAYDPFAPDAPVPGGFLIR